MIDPMESFADRVAIHDLLVRYCRGLDRHDEALVQSVFEPDAVITFYENRGGVARDLIPELVKGVPGCVSAQRTVSTVTITINGDEAGSEAYFTAYYVMARQPEAGQLIVFGGRYLDRLRQTNGIWKITNRVAVHDWDYAVSLPTEYPERTAWMTGRVRGTPDATDPSHEVLRLS